MKEIRFDAGHIHSGDQLDQLTSWVASLGVEPNKVCARGLIVQHEDGSAVLHLSRHVLGAAGANRQDWAREELVSEPLVIPLKTTPPWPTFLTDSGFLLRQRVGLARDLSRRLADVIREIDSDTLSAEVDA